MPESENIPLEIHFRTETIAVQEAGETSEQEIPQPVRRGQLVLSLALEGSSNGHTQKEKGTIRLAARKNCEIAVGGRSIVSSVTGYPHIERQKEKDQDVVAVSVVPIVTVSDDAMKASLTLYPPISGIPALQVEDLQAFLQEAGIVYGVDSRYLNKAIATANQERQRVIEMVVARGMSPMDGIDAHLRMEVELGAVPGKIRGDGSIDFRERRMFVSVEEGQLIATKISPTKGIAGKDVFGRPIPQREGRDIVVRVAEDAVYNEKGGTIRALKAGVVSLVKENTVRVSSRQTIHGDVDFTTGNIYSKSAVEIGGSVQQGFVVAVRGDVLIGRDVQSATVSSHGNLVVKGGIVGAGSLVTIRGDVDLNFLENGTVHAGGNVVIRTSSYYGTLFAEGNIVGDEKTKIVGGTVVCSGSLTVGEIGTVTAGPASVSVGTDVKRFQHFRELQRKAIELETEIALWLQRNGQEAEMSPKMREKERELGKVRTELGTLNLIPGSPSDSLTGDYIVDDDAEITVFGRIFPGTELRIGNLTRKIALNLSKRKFKIDKNTHMIVDVPL